MTGSARRSASGAATAQRRDITIRELLNFTSGLDPNFRLHSDYAWPTATPRR